MYSLLLFCFICAPCLYADTSAGNLHSIMSYEAYATIRHDIPYIFKIDNGKQLLYYFGANHSCDPKNSQYQALETFWQEFLNATNGQERIVLVEGNTRRLAATKEEAIMSTGGEGSYITFLAAQQNIAVVCPEPRKSRLTRELLQEFSIEEITYMEFAQAALQANRYREIRGPTFDIETYTSDSLVNFSYFFSEYFYELSLTLNDIRQTHCKLFNNELNLLDATFFGKITDPVAEHCIINAVCRTRSMLRDKAIVTYIENKLAANIISLLSTEQHMQ